jgi:hypothetical protein
MGYYGPYLYVDPKGLNIERHMVVEAPGALWARNAERRTKMARRSA